ncbi:MAG: hypothetical protein U5R06_02385 [candidate division KSB1 bacterium]|nr:hypothetical protein [candidate division KSB1 bacterium]
MANIDRNLGDFDRALHYAVEVMNRNDGDVPDALIDAIDDLQNEYTSYLEPDIEALIEQVDSLKKENAELRDENDELLNQTG